MSYKHITINERCCIVEYLNLGWSLSKIAKELNRNKSSISREIKRNNLNGRYKAHVAQDKYENRRVKCKPHGKIANASLVNYVQEKLNNHCGLMSIFWIQKVKLFYAALLANNSHCSGVLY